MPSDPGAAVISKAASSKNVRWVAVTLCGRVREAAVFAARDQRFPLQAPLCVLPAAKWLIMVMGAGPTEHLSSEVACGSPST